MLEHVTTAPEIQLLEPDCAADVPDWVESFLPESLPLWTRGEGNVLYRRLDDDRCTLLSASVPQARQLSAEAFELAARGLYQWLWDSLPNTEPRTPIRIWNFIPRILDPLGDQPHRYMIFNRARHEAYRNHFAIEDRLIPTATGTGHFGSDLVIHCLATAESGAPVENPRQTPAYCYSQRYGPKPPCFARATIVTHPRRGDRVLLVGGTASVLGEDSQHSNDLSAQAKETVANLRALLATALDTPQTSTSLARFENLRVYYRRQRELGTIKAFVKEEFPQLHRVEYLHSDLCREELLIEIEGLARLS